MTYEQVVAKVKAKYENVDASSVGGTLAIQVNLVGKNVEGIFYIEAKDGKVNVEPYDYHDNGRYRCADQSFEDSRRQAQSGHCLHHRQGFRRRRPRCCNDTD